MILTLILALGLQQGAAVRRDTDRPEEFEVTRTKTGITLPEKALEVDVTAFLFTFDDFDDSNVDVDFMGIRAEAAYGIFPWLTAEVEVPILRIDADPGDTDSGIGDILIEGKMSLNEARKSPLGLLDGIDLAVGARFTLPTGDDDEGLGEEHATFGLFGAISHRFSLDFALHGELFVFWQSENRPFHGVNATADWMPWGPNISLLAGLNIHNNGTEDTEADIIPGAEIRFPESRAALGIGIPIGLTDESPDFGVLLNGQIGF